MQCPHMPLVMTLTFLASSCMGSSIFRTARFTPASSAFSAISRVIVGLGFDQDLAGQRIDHILSGLMAGDPAGQTTASCSYL